MSAARADTAEEGGQEGPEGPEDREELGKPEEPEEAEGLDWPEEPDWPGEPEEPEPSWLDVQAMEDIRLANARQDTARKVLARLLDPVKVDGTTRWDLASPYLLRHAAEHGDEAGQLAHLFQNWEFLVHADPHSVLTFGAQLETEGRVRALQVYRASVVEHAMAGPDERRHILAVDAVRHRWPAIRYRLYHPLHATPVPWQCRWSTTSSVSSQLRGALVHDTAVSSVAIGAGPVLSYAVTVAQDDKAAKVWDLGNDSLLRELPGHTAALTAAAAGSGRTDSAVVTAAEDGSLRCWDPHTGENRWSIAAHQGAIHGLRLHETHDPPVVVTHGDDGTVGVWDLETGTAHQVFTGVPRRGGMVVTGSDPAGDDLIVVVGEGRIQCLDLLAGEERFGRRLGHGEVRALAGAQVGANPAVVVTHEEGRAQVWDLHAGTVHTTLTGPPSSMDALTVLDTGLECVAVTGGGDGIIRLWDIERGGPPLRQLTGHFGEITALTWYTAPAVRAARPVRHEDRTDTDEGTLPPSSRHRMRPTNERTRRAHLLRALSGHALLSASADHTLHEWNLADGSLRQTFTAHTDAPHTILVTEVAGRPVAVSSGHDGTVRVWTLDDRRARSLGGVTHPLPVRALSMARADGRVLIATGCGDERLRVLTGSDGRPEGIHFNGRSRVTAVALGTTREGPVAVAATDDGRLTARRPERGERLWQWRRTSDASVSALAVGGSRRRPLVLALDPAAGGRLQVRSLTTGRPHPCDLDGLPDVTAIATARIREQPVAATGHPDGTVRLWNLTTGTLRRTLGHPAARVEHLAVAATPAGPLVAACADGRVRVWDADDGGLRCLVPVGRTAAMALGESHGRPVVLTVPARSNTVRFWDAETGEPHTAMSLPEPVGALALVDGVLAVGYGRELAVFSASDNPGPWDEVRETEPVPPLGPPEDGQEQGRRPGRPFRWEWWVLAHVCRRSDPQSLSDVRAAFCDPLGRRDFSRRAVKGMLRSLAAKGLVRETDERGRYEATPQGRGRVEHAERSGALVKRYCLHGGWCAFCAPHGPR